MPGRHRVIVTRSVDTITAISTSPHTLRWNPSGAPFTDVLRVLEITQGDIAVIGGTFALAAGAQTTAPAADKAAENKAKQEMVKSATAGAGKGYGQAAAEGVLGHPQRRHAGTGGELPQRVTPHPLRRIRFATASGIVGGRAEPETARALRTLSSC